MARVPYVQDDAAGPPELVAAIRARRGGGLLNLDRMLLHSAALARGWNGHLGAMRGGLGIPAGLRELAICAVAVLNGAEYEFEQHLQPFLQAGGTAAAAAALRALGSAGFDAASFSVTELAVLQLTEEMTRAVVVSDATFERVRAQLHNDQQIVEMVAVIATYNMVARFLVALQIESAGERRG